jgi:hypothetical protein
MYDVVLVEPLVPVAPGVPAAPVAAVDPSVLDTAEPFAAFMSMYPPGVTDAAADPAVPGALLPMRHPITVIACCVPAAGDAGDCGCPALDCD